MPSHRTLSSLLVSPTTAALLGLLMLAEGPHAVNAHIKMLQPPPLRGENNPQYDFSGFDYSMTNPLLEDGSNFACKGYQADVPGRSQAVDTVKAGQQYEVSLEGSATHGGGSCQFSLSYDGGNTFGVVHSVIGGCPLEKKYSFKIPDKTPAGKNVLLAWTWFNKVGNREMYMNCAAINIESSSTSPLELPAVFKANIFSGACKTVEGDEIVFPNPGASVVYGGKWAGQKPGADALQVTGCSSDQTSSKFVTLQSNTGASPGNGGGKEEDTPKPSVDEPVKTPDATSEKPVQVPTTTSTKATLKPSRGSVPTPTKASQPAVTPTGLISSKLSSSRGNPKTKTSTSPAAIETPSNPTTCTGPGLKCSEDGGSFYLCSNGKWVSMGIVAPGTVCKNGQIEHAQLQVKVANGAFNAAAAPAASESCTPGALVCSEDGNSFSVCNADGSTLTNMGSVAAGTQCIDGKICPARKMNKTRRHKPRRLSHSS